MRAAAASAVAQRRPSCSTRKPRPPQASASSAYGHGGTSRSVGAAHHGPEDLPAAVVQHQHDRVEAVARRLRDLRPRHLEGAVAAEDERPDAGADLRRRARRARRTPSTRRTPAPGSRPRRRRARRGRRRACPRTRRRPRSRGGRGGSGSPRAARRSPAMRRAIAERLRRQVVVVAHALAMAAEPRAQEAADEVADVDVGVGVVADVHAAVDAPGSSARARRGAAARRGPCRSAGAPRFSTRSARSTRRTIARRRDRAHVDAHVAAGGPSGTRPWRARWSPPARPSAPRAGATSRLQLVAIRLDADDVTSGRRAALKRAAVSRTASVVVALVGAREVQAPVPLEDLARHADAALDHVAVDLEVAGTLLAPHRPHDVVRPSRPRCAASSSTRAAQVSSR